MLKWGLGTFPPGKSSSTKLHVTSENVLPQDRRDGNEHGIEGTLRILT